jgi:translation initiation factor 3 subunit H
MADIKEVHLNSVQVEALVVMKILKHANAQWPTTASGSIVGMDADSILEITSSFPFPTAEVNTSDSHQNDHNSASNSASAAPRSKANTAYQEGMIKLLREVNVDANNVGFYTSANMGNFVTSNFIENLYYYQSQTNERIVALVYDVSRSSQGALSLRAFRLSPVFMAAYKEGVAKFTTEKYVQQTPAYRAKLMCSQHAKVEAQLQRYPRRIANHYSQLSPHDLLPPPNPFQNR